VYLAVPSKPIQCHVTAVGTRFISLAWQSPDGTIDMFQVSYWVNQLAHNISLVYSPQPNLTVYGLQPYTVYLFTVSIVRLDYGIFRKIKTMFMYSIVIRLIKTNNNNNRLI